MSERPGGRESEPGPSGRGSGRERVDSPSGPAEGQERGARPDPVRITFLGGLGETDDHGLAALAEPRHDFSQVAHRP